VLEDESEYNVLEDESESALWCWR